MTWIFIQTGSSTHRRRSRLCVELLTPLPVVIPNAVRNLKKCISNFKEWVELPEHDIQAVMQLQLISSTGRTLYEDPAKGRFHQIALESYPTGLYLVRLWDGERWRVQKLMKY